MIDWASTAKKLSYSSEEEMWIDFYLVKKLSVTQLSAKLGVSRNTIRATLDRVGIHLRSRGGANNLKLHLTDEIIEDIRQNGIPSVAKKLGVSYTTLYKRLYHTKPKKEEDGPADEGGR